MGKPIPFQQLTVEFVVVGELDGVTPAPLVSIDPESDDYVKPDERGIRVVRVEGNLGLIDPDFNGLGAQGDRCIPWVYLDTDGVAGAPDAQFAVVDVQLEDGFVTPIAQRPARFSTGGVSRFFSQKPTAIPQGSSLAVVGYPAGSDKIVRVNVVAPNTSLEEAQMKQACCCSDFPCIEIGGGPSISTVTPSFFLISEASTALIEGLFLFTVSPKTNPDGSTTLYPYEFEWVGVDVDATIPTETVEFRILPDGTTIIEVGFSPNTLPGQEFIPGVYNLVGFDPFDPDCNTADDEPTIGLFGETVPICPAISSIDGDIGFQSPNTSGNEIELIGTDLGTIAGGASFTATITSEFPFPDSLTVTSIDVTTDDTAASIFYDIGPFQEGPFTLTLSSPGCPDIVFEDIILVFGS